MAPGAEGVVLRHQENIEIYLRCDTQQVVEWLARVAGPVVLTEAMGDMLAYETRTGTVFVTPDIGDGSFVSVYMKAAGTPWSTDVDCARQAASELGCVVRCDPGRHHPEVHPASDIFLEIHRGAEVLVDWDVDSDPDLR